jgi:hypothetical protein
MRIVTNMHVSSIAPVLATASPVVQDAAEMSATPIECATTSLSNRISAAFRARDWPEGEPFAPHFMCPYNIKPLFPFNF